MAGALTLVSLLPFSPFSLLSQSSPRDDLRLKIIPSRSLTCTNLPRASPLHSEHPKSFPEPMRPCTIWFFPLSTISPPSTLPLVHSASTPWPPFCPSSSAGSSLRTFAHAGPLPRMLLFQRLAWLSPHCHNIHVPSSQRPYLATQWNVGPFPLFHGTLF